MPEITFEWIDEAVQCAMNDCGNDSDVYVWSGELNLVKTPFCSVCAPLKFAQWMVRMHLDPMGSESIVSGVYKS